MDIVDEGWLKNRAASEHQLARTATTPVAREIHAQLAALYAARLAREAVGVDDGGVNK